MSSFPTLRSIAPSARPNAAAAEWEESSAVTYPRRDLARFARMSIGFDYDLGEIIRMGYQEITLKEAVVEYIRRPKDRPYSPSWIEGSRQIPGSL
jgi:hypothetical protein